MKVEISERKAVEVKVVELFAKVSDRGSYCYKSPDGTVIKDSEGSYVPDFFPGDHYGDYLCLEIDIETGQILNWKKPTDLELSEEFEK